MYGPLIAASLAAATLAEPAFAATDTFRPEADVSRANPVTEDGAPRRQGLSPLQTALQRPPPLTHAPGRNSVTAAFIPARMEAVLFSLAA